VTQQLSQLGALHLHLHHGGGLETGLHPLRNTEEMLKFRGSGQREVNDKSSDEDKIHTKPKVISENTMFQKIATVRPKSCHVSTCAVCREKALLFLL